MTKKKRLFFTGIGLGAFLLVVLLTLNVSIAGKPWMAGGCVCISFDKWDMLRADKIVLETNGKTYAITDPALIRSVSQETASGTQSDYCCAKAEDGWMEIYRGDRLLRRMRYISNHNAFAYEADATHWVLFGQEGHAFLSGDISEKMEELLGD